MNKGFGAGVSGQIAFRGTSIKYWMKVMEWSLSGSSVVVPATAQGSAGLENSVGSTESGGIILVGEVTTDGFPLPPNIRYATADLVIQMTDGVTGSITVRINQYDVKYKEGSQNLWSVKLVCTRTGGTAWAGFLGSQTSNGTLPSTNDYLYAGRNKVADAFGLIDESTQVVLFGPLGADTDAAEVTAIGSVLAAYITPPQVNEKVRTTTIERIDDVLARVTIHWTKKTSADDILNPEKKYKEDPGHIEDLFTSGSLTPFTGSATIPTVNLPHLVVDSVEVVKVNDQTQNQVLTLANSNSTLRQTMPRSIRFYDTDRLTDYAGSAIVTSALSMPLTSSLDFRGLELQQVGVDRWVSVDKFGVRTAKQDVTQPRSPQFNDGGFNDFCHIASVVTGNLGSAAANLVNAGTELEQITSKKYVSVKKYGVRTPAQAITQPRSTGMYDFRGVNTYLNSATMVSATSFRSASSNPFFPTSAITPLTSAGRMYEQINAHKFVVTTKLRTQDPFQEIADRGSVSRRSSIEAWTDVVCQPVNCAATDSTQDIANAYYDANQSVANLLTVTAEKINPTRARVLYFYFDPGIMVYGSTRATKRRVAARLNSGTPQVFVSHKNQLNSAGTLFKYWIASMELQTAVRQFTVCRTYAGTTIPDQYAVCGEVNSDTFLGISPGNCIYDGAQYQTKVISGTRIFRMFYFFREDLNGIFNYTGKIDDWIVTSDSVSEGWVDASTIATHQDVTITIPSSANFTTLFLS